MLRLKYLNRVLIGLGTISLSSIAFASGFQLWEQDGAGIGNYHAGYAALAEDASTGFYNPAGLTRIKHPQLVLGLDLVNPQFDFSGDVTATNNWLPFPFNDPDTVNVTQNVKGNGSTHNIVPFFHFATPVNDRVTAGLSVVAPFGLKTVYGRDNFLRVNTIYSKLSVIDVSPEIGFKINPQFSVGAGLDIERAKAEFALSAYNPLTLEYTDGVNSADSATAYGFHIGGLYEFDENTRVGLSYHSQVVHHFSGGSKFSGPAVLTVQNGSDELVSNNAKTKITMPAYTALSAYHHTQNKWAVMGSVIYTQWSSLQNISLQNVAGLIQNPAADPFHPLIPSTSITVSIPQNWHNTWNLSGGASYDLTDTMTLRAGLGYDQSPVPNAYRNLILPDNDRYITALGFSYHPNKVITLDLGWSHYFIKDSRINPPAQQTGAQITTVNGKTKNGGDVFGAQITWNFV